MKKRVLMGLVLLAIIEISGVFAQKVGESVQLGGQTYRVESSSNGRLVLQLQSLLDGVWYSKGRAIITVKDNTGVWTDFGPLGGAWQNAADKGHLKIGGAVWRNIKNTGNLTWSGQQVWVQGNGNAATDITWVDREWILSEDGKTLTMRAGNRNLETFTRQK